jgi:endonuclease/exonuclease/phosphatase family metal-dependent hydrolase
MTSQHSFILTYLPLSILLAASLSSCESGEAMQNSATRPGTERSSLILPEDYVDQVGDTLRVLSWNVEHFVDAYDSPYIDNRRENEPDTVELYRRMSLLADAIRRVDADVVVLQEFESMQLARLIADSLMSDMEYQFFADSESPDWYMNVVVMSRAPLGLSYGYGNLYAPLTYTNESGEEVTEYQRHINTRIFTTEVIPSDEHRFLLTGVHLKAGRGPRNEAMRMGQLRLIAEQLQMIEAATGTEKQLMVGDFNAYPESEEMTFITEKAGLGLQDLLPADAHTHPADSAYRRLDYILINESMEGLMAGTSPEVRYLYDTARQASLSDHLPVVADFVLQQEQNL